ncbi:MAG: S-layer homology domain-containing protein [Schwartzia sp. (in: firmicutes)]
MRKTLVSGLVGAFALGVSATAFAASNPFEDVPADHWAYDAVAQLAYDGIIEGYGDGTYRGDQALTRYEMAQMVARALASPVGMGRAVTSLDRLALEFSAELESLGVRVAALEKKVDEVAWKGRIRYRYIRRMEERSPAAHHDESRNTNQVLFRLEPTARINAHWAGKARIDYGRPDTMHTGANVTNAKVDRLYVEGDYSSTRITLGLFPLATKADYGMVSDISMAGGQVVFGREVKVAIAAGRIHDRDNRLFTADGINPSAMRRFLDGTANYQGIEVYNDRTQTFTWGIGFQRVTQADGWDTTLLGTGHSIKNPNGPIRIWNVGLGYRFHSALSLTGAYAMATGIDPLPGNTVDGKHKHAYAFALNYKGAKANQRGSWGAFLAYRHLGGLSTLYSTHQVFGPMQGGEKGWEIGVSWTPLKNVVGKVQYYQGKELISDHSVKALWTELGFLF